MMVSKDFNTFVNVHDEVIGHPTSEAWALLSRNYNGAANSKLSDELAFCFNASVKESYRYSDSLQYLEALLTVLALCYQEKFTKESHPVEKIIFKSHSIEVDETQNLLYTQFNKAEFLDWKELSLVLKILVLHMALNHDVATVLQNLAKLQTLILGRPKGDNKLQILDLKLMESYMDSLFLHKMLSSPVTEVDSKEVKELFLKNVQLMLSSGHQKDCELLTVVLPKLIKVVTAEGILAKVWEMIFTSVRDVGETLKMLYLTADIWFPTKSDYQKELLDRTMEERLWLLLLNGLSSTIPLLRKQALHLVGKVVAFVEEHKGPELRFCDYQEIRPLICLGHDYQQDLFKKNLDNCYSILKELEEDENHLVTPGFSLLKNLLNDTCENCGFHVAWIRCIFSRILQDDNNAIVRWGLLEVLTLDLELYNNEFLSVVLNALNNTYFYETDGNEEEPTLVKELTIFLNYAETKNTDLVTKFMVQASRMTWKPAALFYVIHALSVVKKVSSVWREIELQAVKSLADLTSTISCRILRLASQIELLEAMTHFVTEPLDLVAVANTLSAFSTSEAFTRGQLAWKRTCAWLPKVVKEAEALRFLEKICGQMATRRSANDLGSKPLSLMIMLFHDGHLLFNSKLCPGITALRNLLSCVSGTNSNPYENAELANRCIELIHHLLVLTSPKDCIPQELISEYANATLRFIFKILRHVTDEGQVENIETYVHVTQKLFTAQSSVIAVPEIFNHIERFEFESRNVIEDEWSSNVRKFFAVKILHACLESTSVKLKDYKFIGPLRKIYKVAAQPSETKGAKGYCNKIASGYYKLVAKLFYEYVRDEPVNEWLRDVNWIEEVTNLIQLGGKDIFSPLVGILSQIFYKEVLRSTDIDDFKSAIRLCWKSLLESKECGLTTEEIMDLMFSLPFLESKETRELTIECTHEMMDKGEKTPELLIIKRLKQTKGEYLHLFYSAILSCLLNRSVPAHVEKIEHQARSYVLDCYQEVYPNYLSNMNANTDVAVRAHAVILLHKMITDDPTHAAKLLPLVVRKLNENQTKPDLDDSQARCIENRIIQVLLVLQPVLGTHDVESLHTLLWDNISSKRSPPSVQLLQEWLLVRIYVENETLCAKIWNLFDQGQEEFVSTLSSTVSVMYQVARFLSSDSQLDFINSAFQYIMPYCMSHKSNVRRYAQVVTSKLYDLASEMSYSVVTERYKDFYSALTKSLEQGKPENISIKSEDFTTFDPIYDYSLESLFYELPRLSNVDVDEYIRPQMFEKFGFKESNSHPLRLLSLRNDVNQADVPISV